MFPLHGTASEQDSRKNAIQGRSLRNRIGAEDDEEVEDVNDVDDDEKQEEGKQERVILLALLQELLAREMDQQLLANTRSPVTRATDNTIPENRQRDAPPVPDGHPLSSSSDSDRQTLTGISRLLTVRMMDEREREHSCRRLCLRRTERAISYAYASYS